MCYDPLKFILCFLDLFSKGSSTPTQRSSSCVFLICSPRGARHQPALSPPSHLTPPPSTRSYLVCFCIFTRVRVCVPLSFVGSPRLMCVFVCVCVFRSGLLLSSFVCCHQLLCVVLLSCLCPPLLLWPYLSLLSLLSSCYLLLLSSFLTSLLQVVVDSGCVVLFAVAPPSSQASCDCCSLVCVCVAILLSCLFLRRRRPRLLCPYCLLFSCVCVCVCCSPLVLLVVAPPLASLLLLVSCVCCSHFVMCVYRLRFPLVFVVYCFPPLVFFLWYLRPRRRLSC